MKVYLVWCKYEIDWDWDLLKIFKSKYKAEEYINQLICFDSYVETMEIE